MKRSSSRCALKSIIEAVIDTNVFVSALTGGLVTGRIYAALLKEEFAIVVSPPLLEEIFSTLTRPVFGLDRTDIERVATFLALHARSVRPDRTVRVCRDPKDDKLLDCLLAARPACLVTGDKDLLVLHPFHNIPIVSPGVFIKRFLHPTKE